MQQVTSIKEIKAFINQNGEMIIGKNKKNNVVIMSIEEYKNNIFNEETVKKLVKAEKQIKEGKTVKAEDVFEELEKKYEF